MMARRSNTCSLGLDVTSHYVFYGARITITCDFSNDKHLDINTVGWVDRRDNVRVLLELMMLYVTY